MGKLLDALKLAGVEITEDIEKKVMTEFIEKKDADLKDTEITNLKEQLKTRDKDIENLKKVDTEKLQAELETLQDKYKTDTEALQKKLSDTEFNNALELELRGTNAKDTTLIKTLLDNEKITFKEGKFEGLADQIEQIKKDRDYLFNPAEQTDNNQTYTYKPSGGKSDTTPASLADAVAQSMGLQQ